jgi:hypothetical protein
MVLSTRTFVVVSPDPGETQVDAVAAHRNPFREQERALPPSFRQAAIGADDAMPGQLIAGRCKDVSHQPRRSGLDIAVSTDKTFRDGAHAANDARRARLGLGAYARPLHASIRLTLLPTRSTEFE